jgi:putative transposase
LKRKNTLTISDEVRRTVKYEEVYLFDYEDSKDVRNRLGAYLNFYNKERVHQSLEYQTPEEVYFERR